MINNNFLVDSTSQTNVNKSNKIVNEAKVTKNDNVIEGNKLYYFFPLLIYYNFREF